MSHKSNQEVKIEQGYEYLENKTDFYAEFYVALNRKSDIIRYCLFVVAKYKKMLSEGNERCCN